VIDSVLIVLSEKERGILFTETEISLVVKCEFERSVIVKGSVIVITEVSSIYVEPFAITVLASTILYETLAK
jgi:hypothetical protein